MGNKQKILVNIGEVQKLIIIDDYNKALRKLDTLFCQIRIMADNKHSTFAENERKGGVL